MKFLLIMTISATTLLAHNAQSQEIPDLKPIVAGSTDKAANRWITITKVQKPAAATRDYIVQQSIVSIPEYAKMPGLLFKAYSFSEKADYFGGIYLWADKTSATNWFSTAWFERVKKTYNSPGEVNYYQVKSVKTLKTISETKGSYYMALSIGKKQVHYGDGLICIFTIIDANGKSGNITLWNNETTAREYFKENPNNTEFFDTPVLLNNQ